MKQKQDEKQKIMKDYCFIQILYHLFSWIKK